MPIKKAQFYLYRNLRTKTFSLKYKERVFAHPSIIELTDVLFNISEKGRRRVIKEHRKNVHATLSASSYKILESLPAEYKNIENFEEIYYNPYFQKTFEIKKKEEPIFKASKVICFENKVYLIKI